LAPALAAYIEYKQLTSDVRWSTILFATFVGVIA